MLHTYIHTHTVHTQYIHTYIHTYTHTYIHTYIHTYTHAYIHAYTHYIHTYLPTYTHTYLHTYIHTHYIHTYVHTYTRATKRTWKCRETIKRAVNELNRCYGFNSGCPEVFHEVSGSWQGFVIDPPLTPTHKHPKSRVISVESHMTDVGAPSGQVCIIACEIKYCSFELLIT
jgi:hypothetical protein